MIENFSINAIRGFFAAICIVMGFLVAQSLSLHPLWGTLGGFGFAAFMIALEAALKHFTFRDFSHGTIGLMVGLFCAWLVLRVFQDPWFKTNEVDIEGRTEQIRSILQLFVYLGLGFLGMMLAMRSNREEFSFIIPYVRFRQDALQEQPLLLDTNVIIDGRIPAVCGTGFLSGSLIVPRFVIDELHMLADSNDPIRRDRGKRGLDCLNAIKEDPSFDVAIKDDPYLNEEGVDAKLVAMARRLGARIVTNDANLADVARLQGVRVLNFNELNRALRPVVAPGDRIELMMVKEGKDAHQAVGYLPDGTMIVVNHAAERIGQSEEIVVAGTLQTSAGRLIFAELAENWQGASGPSLKKKED